MMPRQNGEEKRRADHSAALGQSGFTVLEILVALVMGVIFFAAISTLVIDQTQTHEDHQMKVMMQQDGRAALAVISNDLMLAGYSPGPRSDAGSGRLATFRAAGINTIDFTYDTNANGSIRMQDTHDNNLYTERTVYSFAQSSGQLRRNNNTNALLQNVAAFRVLYAYDADDLGAGADKYGVLEKDTNGRVIWGYDDDPSDGDNRLTMYYTFDDEGKIPTRPATPAQPAIPAQPGAGPGGATIPAQPAVPAQPGGPADPANLTDNPPSYERIRAAKIWLLMRSNKRKNKDTSEVPIDNVPVFDMTTLDTDNFSYRLYTATVKFRNMYY